MHDCTQRRKRKEEETEARRNKQQTQADHPKSMRTKEI